MKGSAQPAKPREGDYRPVDENYFVSTKLTEEEVAKVREAIDRIERPDVVKARWKIEVTFGVGHHIDGTPTYGIVNFWENGANLGGDGDALTYVCPGKKLGSSLCEKPIPDSYNGFSVVVCPTCQTLWRADQLIAEVFYRMPIDKWADAVLYWFVQFDHDADVRVKYNYMDIRKAAEKEQAKAMYGDLLNVVRSPDKRTPRLYPLRNILKDVSNGADLRMRLLSFLRM